MVLCRAGSWTQWFLWVLSNSVYSVISFQQASAQVSFTPSHLVGLILYHIDCCLIIYTQKCVQMCYHSSSQALFPLTTSQDADHVQAPGKGGGTWWSQWPLLLGRKKVEENHTSGVFWYDNSMGEYSMDGKGKKKNERTWNKTSRKV